MNTKRKMPVFLVQNKLLPTLYLYMVFAESISPILFACRDDAENVYVCSCHCQNATKQEWIIAPTSYSKLIALLTDKISIRDIFVEDNHKLYLVTKFANATTEIAEKDLPSLHDLLPTAGYYMEAASDEFNQVLEELQAENSKTAEFTKTVIQSPFRTFISSFPIHILVPEVVSTTPPSTYWSNSRKCSIMMG